MCYGAMCYCYKQLFTAKHKAGSMPTLGGL